MVRRGVAWEDRRSNGKVALGAVAVVALAASGGCAAGAEGPTGLGGGGSHHHPGASMDDVGGAGGGFQAPSSSVVGSTVSSGGFGGTGVSSSTSATVTSSSVASSTAATTTSSSGSGGGGPGGTILTVMAEGNDVTANYQSLSMMTGFSNPYNELTTTPVALAFRGTGLGVAALRSEPSGELRYATWSGGWSPGFGTDMLAVQPSPPITIVGGPSAAGSCTKIHIAYQDVDLNFYYGEHDGSWFVTHEAIAFGGVAATGPVPPAITTLADVPIIAYVGSDGDVHDQARPNSAWTAQHPHGVSNAASITPAIAALTQGAELVLVYNDDTNGLRFAIRSGGSWSAPAPISGASAAGPVSIAPIAAGGAVLAYQGVDGYLYTSTLSANPPFTWSLPVGGVSGSLPFLVSPPAVATGAVGADAELIYLDTSYIVYGSRMIGGVWGAPFEAGSASHHLAIATGH